MTTPTEEASRNPISRMLTALRGGTAPVLPPRVREDVARQQDRSEQIISLVQIAIVLIFGGLFLLAPGGYNTVMEVLAARTPAVCIPYAGGLESEQTLRCRLLADRGALEIIEPDAVNPKAIAAAADRAVGETRAPASGLDLGGAQNSAEIMKSALNRHRMA